MLSANENLMYYNHKMNNAYMPIIFASYQINEMLQKVQ